MIRQHTRCRVCNAPLPKPYLDLGLQPLANALIDAKYLGHDEWVHERETRLPLAVTRCSRCDLSQLTVVVDPSVLYAGYRFRSGQSEAWVKHCEDLANRCTVRGSGQALDLACNDGTMLGVLDDCGWGVTGVDPAPSPEALASEWLGPAIITGAWPDVDLPHDSYDLIIAQNVLGHVDDVLGFLRGIQTVLAPEGRAIIEVPHVGELLSKTAFDTIYHEHLSYWSLGPLQRAAWRAGLRVVDVERLDTHGGSRRYWLAHAETPMKHSVPEERLDEYRQHLHEAGPYERFAGAVSDNVEATRKLIFEFNNADCYFVGWGASAKAAVYLNALHKVGGRIGDCYMPDTIFDDCAEKCNLLMPGVHVDIESPPPTLEDVDVLWVLSWNNFAAIKAKAESRGFRGKYLLTHPTPRLIDA